MSRDVPAADERMADALTLIASIYDERNDRDRKVHERLIGLLDQVSDKIVAVLQRSVASEDEAATDDIDINLDTVRSVVVSDLVPNPAGLAMASIILDTMKTDPGERHFTDDDRRTIQAWMVNKLAASTDNSLTITRDAWMTIADAIAPTSTYKPETA